MALNPPPTTPILTEPGFPGLVCALTRGGYAVETDLLRYADGTGTYDATTNPGGYGGPNPARDYVALFLVGQALRSDGQPGEFIGRPIEDTDNPLTRTEFALRPGADGVFDVRLLGFHRATAAQLDALVSVANTNPGAVYFDTDAHALRQNVNGAWVDVLPETLQDSYTLALGSQEALTPRSQALCARLLERVVGIYYDGALDTFQNPSDQHLVRLHQAADTLLASADICWQRAQPSLFQLRVERLQVLAVEAARLL